MKKQSDTLDAQVAEARRTIYTDGYAISVGELTSMYKEKDLVIQPQYQRFYRWSDEQKSRLIESLLLGIPIPSIFVAQQDNGQWELVDGLQRISAILELQGELIDESGNRKPPFELTETPILMTLKGRAWLTADPDQSLSESLRRDVRRAKIDVKIIKRDSSPQTKYDLFRRLNSYGSTLTAQETRSALLVSVSPGFFSWLEELVSFPSYRDSVLLSERLVEESYHLELVLRFLMLHDRPAEQLTQSSLRDFPRKLDDASVGLATAFPANRRQLERTFKETFDTIARHGGEKVFRRWNPDRSDYTGSFLTTAYEVFALGLGFHVAHDKPYRKDLLDIVNKFWIDTESGFSTGRSTEARLSKYVVIGRELLSA